MITNNYVAAAEQSVAAEQNYLQRARPGTPSRELPSALAVGDYAGASGLRLGACSPPELACIRKGAHSSQEQTFMKIRTDVRAGGVRLVNHNQSGVRVRSNVQADELAANHNQSGLMVRTSVKAGGIRLQNHNQSGARVRSNVRAGKLAANHNQRGVKVRSGVQAGGLWQNHNQSGVWLRSKVRAGTGGPIGPVRGQGRTSKMRTVTVDTWDCLINLCYPEGF